MASTAEDHDHAHGYSMVVYNTRDDIEDDNTIARCRELLGDEADGLSDEEIDRVRRHADALAHVIIDVFLDQCMEKDSQL